ncbi:hypothetical protein FACS189434_02940 [Bacteroidia bacterium]|nr:hypothetical protein FACS189434_02940 [Bacteroidia bacterium]
MLEDVDFLQDYIHKYFFQLALLEQRTGINIDEEFNQLKQKINSTTSTAEFAQIIRQGLDMLNDAGHTRIVPKQQVEEYLHSLNYLLPIANISLSDTTNAMFYYSLITDSLQSRMKTGIRTKYMNGEYFNARPFTYNDILINSGEKITAINGIPINKFINDHLFEMYDLRWEPIDKKWYSLLFTKALPLLGMEQYTLTIGDKDVKLDCSKTVDNLQREHRQSTYTPKVLLIDNDILYIRMPMMYYGDWYINELLQAYTPEVKKIIIDVRDNFGGNDGVWIDLLKKIIDEPITYNYRVGMNHNDGLENILLSSFKDLKKDRKKDRTEIFTETTLYPDSNSVHFKGKIYVFQNEFTYSAASALSSVAWQNENLILVGMPSAFISGYTLPALMFKLPHSEIVFSLAFSADMTGGNENPYMDKVEVLIKENIDEFLDKTLNNDAYSEEYLVNKDPLVKYVKENH